MALSFAVLEISDSKDRQEKVRGISQMLEGCTEQKVAAKRPTLMYRNFKAQLENLPTYSCVGFF